jgi:2-(3-amino-3-carboxypropyl)histidine synthase
LNNILIECGSYEIDISRIVTEAKNWRKILLHAPNGLKHLYYCLLSLFERLNIETYLSLSPGYGACDLPLDEAEILGVDALIHLGHEEYPLVECSVRSHVLYIPVYYRGAVLEDLTLKLIDVLKSMGVKSLTVSSTLIESKQRELVAKYLTERGFKVYNVYKPILGCHYIGPLAYEKDVDAHLVVGGGLFHPLGLGLISSKVVLALDVYQQRIWNASEESLKILKKRLYMIASLRTSNARRMGLLIGSRCGQYRPSIVGRIEEEAKRSGYEVYKIASSYLTPERLIAIDDALRLDFYVVTSCPRLPIDDLGDFYKPVLTPGEFIMLVKGIERYIYPW